ncbi:hypothetical protein D9619_008953 [Psilocybe cf. subviscida]|uniref:Uncharacterized protein n=1 Tax=Psilocybe cf. subviscida TaxID=2480587 RepID=A0A8H5BUS0_9AGAR|nr:hypothetical protein D9619_008953 [Psilocybe cf. subviscida]
MAVIYKDDAGYSQDISISSEILEHSRDLSISSATLLGSSTIHSQPTDPLLHALPPGAAPASYFDSQNKRQSVQFDNASNHLRWDDQISLNTDAKEHGEMAQWQRGTERPFFRGRQRTKFIMETVIAAWAAFNSIRYFMTCSIYGKESTLGRLLCILLGTCTAAAVALYLCSQSIEYVRRTIHSRPPISRKLIHLRQSLHIISSIFVLGPAVVNLVFVFVWRNSSNSRYNLHNRCHIDIDGIWSVERNFCIAQSPAWSVWISIAAIRAVATFLALITYHAVSYIYPEIPHRPAHQRLRSDSYVSTISSPTTPGSKYPSSVTATMLPHTALPDLRQQHQLSESTLTESYARPASRLGHARSYSSGNSTESGHGETMPSLVKSMSDSERERETRHQSLLAQISQETDQALQFALGSSSASTSNPYSPSSEPPPPSYHADNLHLTHADYDSDNDDNDTHALSFSSSGSYVLRPIPPTLGYNEFGLPYPPDQPVRILNGYVRRMPTIESMGSGELAGSSIGRGNGSLFTSSRPPTRNTLLSFASTEYEYTHSRPPSRSNSLSARAELLAASSGMPPASPSVASGFGTSEHGELLEPGVPRAASPTNHLDALNPPPAAQGETVSSTGSAGSYHTATTGSLRDYLPPLSPISTNSRSSSASAPQDR